MEQEKPMVCTDKDFDRFYVALKLNLKTNRYECIYSHNQEVFEIARKTEDYDTFIQIYIERFIHDADKSKLRDFLLSDKLTENLVHGYAEQDIVYRRIESEKSYIKMRAKKYVDIKDNIAMITLHNVKRTYRSVMEMKRELQKNERDKTKQYWNMVSYCLQFWIIIIYQKRKTRTILFSLQSRCISNCRKIIRNMELQTKK